MKKYYSMEKNKEEANINIYGDITSWPWNEEDVSASGLVKELEALGDVSKINVYINSYGGEVAEGLAIYNALKRHKAKVTTICDGFACSIASVIFMAGDERIMNESSLLMIHNAWTMAAGNAEELRKQADDLEKITQASVEAYKANSNLTEKEIKKMMDAETWILPSEAMEYGFATAIGKEGSKSVSQSVKSSLIDLIMICQKAKADEEGESAENNGENDEDEEENGEDENAAKTGEETGENEETEEEEETEEKPEESQSTKPEQKLGFEIFLKI